MSASRRASEQLFRQWQSQPAHSDETRWQALAERIEGRLATDENEDNEAWLLQAPLPPETGEPRVFVEPRPPRAASVRSARSRSGSPISPQSIGWLGGALAAAAALVLLLSPELQPSLPGAERASAANTESSPAARAERDRGSSTPAAPTPVAPGAVTPLAALPAAPDDVQAPLASRSKHSVRSRAPNDANRAPEVALRADQSPPASPAEDWTSEPSPSEAEMVPAAQPKRRSAQPSLAAAQEALRLPLERARLCLGGEDLAAQEAAVPRATVTFAADGAVSRVEVAGLARGAAPERCVQAALKSARVKPFTDPVFSIRTSIRP